MPHNYIITLITINILPFIEITKLIFRLNFPMHRYYISYLENDVLYLMNILIRNIAGNIAKGKKGLVSKKLYMRFLYLPLFLGLLIRIKLFYTLLEYPVRLTFFPELILVLQFFLV